MNILFCIDNNYISQIILAMGSIHFHNSGNQQFFFIYSNISSSNQDLIRKYAIKIGLKEPIFIRFKSDKIDILPINGQNWSKEIYYRLFAPYIINVDKILYLDGDVICTGDLHALYSLDCTMAAAKNDDQSACQRLNLPQEQPYFNSGVLLLNLKKIRSLFSKEDILQDLIYYKDILSFPDQDFINIKFGKDIRPIPKKFNYMISVAEINPSYSKEKSPVLIHYVMEKPWRIKFPYKTDIPYFKQLSHSNKYLDILKLYFFHRLYRLYQLLCVDKKYRKI